MQDTIRQTRPKQNGKYLTLVLQMILLCLIIGIYMDKIIEYHS